MTSLKVKKKNGGSFPDTQFIVNMALTLVAGLHHVYMSTFM